MSKNKPQKIYTAQKLYTDREKVERDEMGELDVKILTLETAFLLLSSEETDVLMTVLKFIMDFVRKQDENIEVVKTKGFLDVLIGKQFYITIEDTLLRRIALYLTAVMIETIDTLNDIDTAKTYKIMEICLSYYTQEDDDFCLEYLSVIMNKCLEDPQVAKDMCDKNEYFQKLFMIITTTDNPDTLMHSIEALWKILQLLSRELFHYITMNPKFPIDRLICDLTNEFTEIRTAALRTVKTLIVDTGEDTPFAANNRSVSVLHQLSKAFCDNAMAESAVEVVDVLTAAMRTEQMCQIFFEQNLFDQILQCLTAYSDNVPEINKCQVIAIFAETAKYPQFLMRLYSAEVTELFVDCLLNERPPAPFILLGLNRLMKLSESANIITNAYTDGVIRRLIVLIRNKDVNSKTREQAAELINNLLIFQFKGTGVELMQNDFANVLGEIFDQEWMNLTIDLVQNLFTIIESMAQNSDFRQFLAASETMTKNLALLLQRSFSMAVIVANGFRCLSTLVDEELARTAMLHHFIVPSIKRGLKSLSNLVKTSVTNFIMQTTRFSEFITSYIDDGVLEVLIMHQKHSFCVSTWNPAIESILSKTPTLKFAIRNHLSFTDSTRCGDFYVSKAHYNDFRIFHNILIEEVSSLSPIIVIAFNRPVANAAEIVEVPANCFLFDDKNKDSCPWQFCRRPGDPTLPKYLEELNELLSSYGLMDNPEKMRRCVDFENVAKRAKLIAQVVANHLSEGIKPQDINAYEDCEHELVKCHLKELGAATHCNIIPMGNIRSGCQFERALLFKGLADQIGLPSTLQRSVDGAILFNEVPLPVQNDYDIHCDTVTMQLLPWRMLRPTHIVDLMYNIGDLYAIQSRQALQYLRLG